MLLGLVYYNRTQEDAAFYVDQRSLIYYNRAGSTCGTYDTLVLPSFTQTLTTQNSLTISPNPATTSLTVQSTNEPITQLTITNLLGQTLYCHGERSRTMTNANYQLQTIDISALQRGVYIIKINNTEVRKFVKE
jgi:hypothetical protein